VRATRGRSGPPRPRRRGLLRRVLFALGAPLLGLVRPARGGVEFDESGRTVVSVHGASFGWRATGWGDWIRPAAGSPGYHLMRRGGAQLSRKVADRSRPAARVRTESPLQGPKSSCIRPEAGYLRRHEPGYRLAGCAAPRTPAPAAPRPTLPCDLRRGPAASGGLRGVVRVSRGAGPPARSARTAPRSPGPGAPPGSPLRASGARRTCRSRG